MGWFTSKDELRRQVHEYRDHLAILVHENYQLRRGFEQVQSCLNAAEVHIHNTEEFLAVLQGEQVAETTELN